MISALLRRPSTLMEAGERTHLGRSPIDPQRARVQHQTYALALSSLGLQVEILEAADDLPDCAFVEDMALILPEASVLLRPGASSRSGELAAIAAAMPADRPGRRLASGRMDGGDLLVVGHRIFVGQSTRTDGEGLLALQAVVQDFGYRVQGVTVPGALHLKTAVTALDAGTLLLNPDWIDEAAFPDFRRLHVVRDEPFGANTLTLGGKTLVQASTPRTRSLLEAAGFPTHDLDISEFAKAEAGLTCLSLIVPAKA